MDAKDAAEATTAILFDGALMLGAALVFVTIFRRLGLGATLGYIVGGAVIGPYALGLIPEPEALASVSEIGIALLLFLVGLELNPSRLWRLRKDIFGLGLAQVMVCGVALSALIHFALNFTIESSIAIGMPLALSSTAQVLPMLRSTGQLNHPRGERAFSVLLFQDLSIVPMITIIAAMSRAPADPEAPPGGMLVLYTVGAIVGLVLVGRFVLNPLFRLIGRFGERELFVVAGLFAVIASAALMEMLHLSTALGAFIAGVMLAESPYRHELESDVEPFRSILLGLFFLSVGMTLDIGAVAARPAMIFGLAISIIAIKALLIAGLGLAFGMKRGRAIWLGLLLSQAGEFGFVLFGQAAAAQLVQPSTASMFSAIVTLSMVSTPFLMMVVEEVLRRMPEPDADLDGPETSPETNAIVVGYGRFGQTVAQMLMAKRIPVTIIDSKPAQIELSGEFGTKVYYGDGTRLDILRTAGADRAEAIIFCHETEDFSRETIAAIMEAFPQAAILIRAYDRRQIMEWADLDVDFIQRELFESAVIMGREALAKLGVARREAERVEREYRSRDTERLELQSASGDIRSGRERMFTIDHPLADEAKDPA
jgi:glutathione-regulated potassium-efflux system protein KefB